MKKFTLLSVFIMLFCAIVPSVNTYAYDTTSSSEVVMKFIQEISLQNGNYVTWKESNPIFGYELKEEIM